MVLEPETVRIRVILADDHVLVREGLQMLLEAAGDVEVVGVAGDGREALALAERLTPDVAIIDITMPVMSGIETIAAGAERCPGVRFLVLSMHAGRQHVIEAMRSGAAGYVLKAAAGDELLEALREVHAGRRFMSPAAAASIAQSARAAALYDPLPGAPELERLSPRQREIVALLADGKSSGEVATLLGVSVHTIETHRRNLMTKMGFHGVADIVKFAIRHGLTERD